LDEIAHHEVKDFGREYLNEKTVLSVQIVLKIRHRTDGNSFE
jgi:hypothetical protein